MSTDVQLLPGAIGEILVSSVQTGRLTLCDRYGLMAALLDESLEEDELRAINRIVRAVARGKIAIS